MEQNIILEIHHVSKQFSVSERPAVIDVSLTLSRGEILGFLGPSGCGKTTLLRIIAGFETPSAGRVVLQGEMVAGEGSWIPPEQRNTGMVFQDYALFPHLTVAENVAFGLKKRGDKRLQIRQRVSEVLSVVRLTGLEKRYPHELSGGQQQRVALARALAPEPALILLDEPLSNLDVQVRLQLRQEVRRILKETGISAIFVTHDQEEALAISDKIAVMSKGQIEQLGTPEDIYTQPASRFVAEFVTQANFLPAIREGNYWQTEIGSFQTATVLSSQGTAEGELMIREEDLLLQPQEGASLVILDRHFLGREYRYCLKTPSGHYLHARTSASLQLSVGMRVHVSTAVQPLPVFPTTPDRDLALID